jgi:type VI secretion system protein VasJ
MPSLDADIVALGRDPISADAPAGESLRDDTEFDALRAEIAKTESLRDVVIDWDFIVRSSAGILRGKSKDYRVASYLVFGLFQTKGYEGLLRGLQMYEPLLRNYWEGAFPEKSRLRGRLGAVEWLQDRIAATLARKERKACPNDVVLELEKATQDFVSAVSDLLGSEAPKFSELLSDASARANDLRSRLAAAEKSKEEQARRAEAIALGEVVDSSCAERVLEECRERLWRVAAFYFEADSSDPFAYCLRRGITWGWLASPPIHENLTTHVRPVPPDIRQRCEALWTQCEWQSLVDFVESNFSTSVFALDLQRYCVHALGQLGEKYGAAKLAIESELAGLVRRFPELLDLKFSDATPFAGLDTKSWIQSEVLSVFGGSRAGAEPDGRGVGEGEQDLESATLEARHLLESGKLQEAVDLFKEGIVKAAGGRSRFLWRLQLARLCMDSGRPQLALPQLVILDEDVSRFGLENWEPQLSVALIKQLFLCRQKLAAGMPETRPDVERELHELYKRLWRLDASAALAVEL